MRRGRGELERAVLEVVRASVHPLVVGEVLVRLDPAPAYTTVMTTLSRLHTRGLLDRDPRGRAYAYRPASTGGAADAIAAANRMQRLVHAQGTPVDVLSRFVAQLEPEDERLLRSLLTEPAEGSHRPSPPEGGR